MGTPTHLLTLEVGGGSEVLDATADFEQFELPAGHERNVSEEVVVIRGTITVSP